MYDFREQTLKKDHANRPLWVCPNAHIFFDTESALYKPAYDFLISIAEPLSRPERVHEYVLTPHSLRAAVSVGLRGDTIVAVLERLSKSKLPDALKVFVDECTGCYGRCKLVIRHNKFFVESGEPQLLMRLLRDDVIRGAARAVNVTVAGEARAKEYADVNAFLLESSVEVGVIDEAAAELAKFEEKDDDEGLYDHAVTHAKNDDAHVDVKDGGDAAAEIDVDMDAQKVTNTTEGENAQRTTTLLHSFEIDPLKVEFVKSRCMDASVNCPLLEEYDFKHDTVNADLDIQLKPHVDLRPYQERGLAKMFGNGRGRSGIVVLPCGAGKSLLGIAASCRIGKSVLCLCTNSVSVDQWKYQFKLWTNLHDNQIARFTGESKETFTGESGVLISTFQMIADRGRRSEESRRIVDFIKGREWGLLVMDEVHVVPANMFRKVIGIVKAHCKLGLTATLVREDELIDDLNFLIGPKLYEANWLDLTAAGHLARVQCNEVWCPMTREFMREYLRDDSGLRRQLLYVMNPYKLMACKYLIEYHERQRGDKIIVFSDNIFALRTYATMLHKPFIYGDTSHGERTRILNLFKMSTDVNTLFLSKVGDNSIDIPNANVIIQISSHAGSRRQEAQRLGRILRPKQGGAMASCLDEFHGSGGQGSEAGQPHFNAFFYSLVSTDTREMYFSKKREEFLINQGYAFRVITNILEHATHSNGDAKHNGNGEFYNGIGMKKDDQLNLLTRVMEANASDGAIETLKGEDDTLAGSRSKSGGSRPAAARVVGSMRALSGATGMAYAEFDREPGGVAARNAATMANAKRDRHKIFKQRDKLLKQQRGGF